MKLYDDMQHILRNAREKPREIQFIDGEKEVDTLTFAELWSDALALLVHYRRPA